MISLLSLLTIVFVFLSSCAESRAFMDAAESSLDRELGAPVPASAPATNFEGSGMLTASTRKVEQQEMFRFCCRAWTSRGMTWTCV